MAEEEYPPHLVHIIENASEVSRLVQIHTRLTGGKRGRRSGVEVLNKSGIVLLVACWEAFIEEVARRSFRFLLRHAKKPKDFPGRVLALEKDVNSSNGAETKQAC